MDITLDFQCAHLITRASKRREFSLVGDKRGWQKWKYEKQTWPSWLDGETWKPEKTFGGLQEQRPALAESQRGNQEPQSYNHKEPNPANTGWTWKLIFPKASSNKCWEITPRMQLMPRGGVRNVFLAAHARRSYQKCLPIGNQVLHLCASPW